MPAAARSLLTDRVYQFLASQLAARTYAVGERINARTVAETLAVSRTTVNKALERLVAAGYLRVNESRHSIVTALPSQLKLHDEASFEFTNQTESTYEKLLDRILQGHYQPGGLLKERPVGQELGVNPATVRRAAEWLRNDGLLERMPRRGWRVTMLGARDLKDVYGIRALLEPLAIQRAVHRITDETLDSLAADTERLIVLGEQASVYERRQADHRFHMTLCESSGDRVLAETLDPLIRKALLVTTVGFRFGRASRSFEEHREIVAALRQRDAKEATRRMRNHLRNAIKFNVEIWERR
jgi:DNA-binding GntR family transcriptional regulator